MTREEFIKVKIGHVLYNKDTYEVVTIGSQWSSDKGEVRDDEYLSVDTYGTSNSYRGVRMGDYDKWEYYGSIVPDPVRLRVLEVDLRRLENYVYQRLR